VVVPGLYACGEAACVSVHGANRLGANSLLDLVVFGRAVGHDITSKLKPDTPLPPIRDDAGQFSIDNLDATRYASGDITAAALRLQLQKEMQNNAAVFRTEETLKEGVDLLDKTIRQMPNVSIKDRSMIWYVDFLLRLRRYDV
jgi:succinate dehydrogenase (ubiquinone) flavoprotein subunit